MGAGARGAGHFVRWLAVGWVSFSAVFHWMAADRWPSALGYAAIVALFGAAIMTGLTFNYEGATRDQRALQNSRTPLSYLAFPPLAAVIKGDWTPTVSTRFLYGPWGPFVEAWRGASAGESLCHDPKFDVEVLNSLANPDRGNAGAAPSFTKDKRILSVQVLGVHRTPSNVRSAPLSAEARVSLRCAACGSSFVIGEDAVAVSIESALRQRKGAVAFSDGQPAEREDLVSSLADLAVDKRPTALERGRTSWQLIRDSLARGEARTWRCGACDTANRYPVRA